MPLSDIEDDDDLGSAEYPPYCDSIEEWLAIL